MEKRQFSSPEDLNAEQAPVLHEHPEIKAIVGPGILLGTWANLDPNTRGLVKVVLSWKAGSLHSHLYGACTPTPCDWGDVPAIMYGANVSAPIANAFSAVYAQGFKDSVVIGLLESRYLTVRTFNHFKDGSGRSNYDTLEHFKRT